MLFTLHTSRFTFPRFALHTSLVVVMRFGIVKLSSLGDVIHALPVAHAIRQALPTAHITWVVEAREQAILEGNPDLDAVISVDTRRWRRSVTSFAGLARVGRAIREIRGSLIAARFDIVIDLQGLLKSGLIAGLSGARGRIGFSRRFCREPLNILFTNQRVTPSASLVHVVEQYLALLQPLGVLPQEIAFPIPVNVAIERRMEDFLREHGVKPHESIVALNPGAGRPEKRWSLAGYRELGERIVLETGARILLLWGPGEAELAKANIRYEHRPEVPSTWWRLLGRDYCYLPGANPVYLCSTPIPDPCPLLPVPCEDMPPKDWALATAATSGTWLWHSQASLPVAAVGCTMVRAQHTEEATLWNQAASALPISTTCIAAFDPRKDYSLHVYCDSGGTEADPLQPPRWGLVALLEQDGRATALHHRSARHHRVTRHATTGESYAMEFACAEMEELCSMLQPLTQGQVSTHLYGDCLGQVQLANNRLAKLTGSGKDLALMVVRAAIAGRLVDHLHHVPGVVNPADALTKAPHRQEPAAVHLLLAFSLGKGPAYLQWLRDCLEGFNKHDRLGRDAFMRQATQELYDGCRSWPRAPPRPSAVATPSPRPSVPTPSPRASGPGGPVPAPR